MPCLPVLHCLSVHPSGNSRDARVLHGRQKPIRQEVAKPALVGSVMLNSGLPDMEASTLCLPVFPHLPRQVELGQGGVIKLSFCPLCKTCSLLSRLQREGCRLTSEIRIRGKLPATARKLEGSYLRGAFSG